MRHTRHPKTQASKSKLLVHMEGTYNAFRDHERAVAHQMATRTYEPTERTTDPVDEARDNKVLDDYEGIKDRGDEPSWHDEGRA